MLESHLLVSLLHMYQIVFFSRRSCVVHICYWTTTSLHFTLAFITKVNRLGWMTSISFKYRLNVGCFDLLIVNGNQSNTMNDVPYKSRITSSTVVNLLHGYLANDHSYFNLIHECKQLHTTVWDCPIVYTPRTSLVIVQHIN